MPKFSDLVDPSNFLFLMFTFSETELTTNTLASVDPSFLALDKHLSAIVFRYSFSLIIFIIECHQPSYYRLVMMADQLQPELLVQLCHKSLYQDLTSCHFQPLILLLKTMDRHQLMLPLLMVHQFYRL